MEMTKMEDVQNGRRSKWKTTKMEDNQNRRRPNWKVTQPKPNPNPAPTQPQPQPIVKIECGSANPACSILYYTHSLLEFNIEIRIRRNFLDCDDEP